jgi:sugar (pentulose or hexulose) kinase
MNVLAIDVGSSSVKMAILRNGKLSGEPARAAFPTRFTPQTAEVNPDDIVAAIAKAAKQLGKKRAGVDVIALDTMAPSWVAMDGRGNAITPIVTHQDRRSIHIAEEIEARIGKTRHLAIAGVRPIPGGISSTTCAWFLRHERSLMKRADLVGHVQTYLHRRFCGARVVDPSHASFMGVYRTIDLAGWSEELHDAVGLSRSLLPEVQDARTVGGWLNSDAARLLGLPEGTPMLTGMIDTGGAILLAGGNSGQLVNVVGTTDVLALCTDHPRPHERLLTRALGTGRKWLCVGTIAAAGSSLVWAREQLFPELSESQFFKLVKKLSKDRESRGTVRFDPYLAGDRCAVEQKSAAFSGLTLASTRQQMLAAIIEALARASADRIELLQATGTRINRNVLISGGGDGALADLMHRDWKGKWRFRIEPEATLRGVALLAEGID